MSPTRRETEPAVRMAADRGATTRARKPNERRRSTPEAGMLAEDRRLARLHLRLGGLSLARAELEDLHRRGDLDKEGAADLAEACWRSGDLVGAAAAAADHLAQRGSRPVAVVIAAEAAAAAGQPGEARAHVEALGAVDALTLDALFAGMPRRAFWPAVPGRVTAGVTGGVPAGMPGGVPATADPERSPQRARLRPGARLTTSADEVAGAAAPTSGTDPAEELAGARNELATGNAADAARGTARLALVLRLDPTLAPAVLGVLGRRRDAAGLTVEGDACRLLGRHLEAEAAFAAARRALGALEPEHRA